MKSYVSAEAHGTGECGHRQASECRHGMVLRRKTGKDQVEPHNIRLAFPYRFQQTHRRGQVVKFPATNYIKAGKFSLRFGIYRLTIPVGSELIVRQFVRQNGQVDHRIAPQLARNVEGVLVQLAPARRKCRNQADSHGIVFCKLIASKQADLYKRSKLLVLAGEIKKTLLLQSERETDRVAQQQFASAVLKRASHRHAVGNSERTLDRVINME